MKYSKYILTYINSYRQSNFNIHNNIYIHKTKFVTINSTQ